MCGIAGILNLSQPIPLDPAALLRMIGALRHRGPDEAGVFLDDRVGLANARLSIVDLASGTQPIHNEDETLWIVYNGEVFNHPELREELLSRNHSFYTSSDTEVILHLYEEQGPDCLRPMNGQWALAIWDARRRSLFLARDRMGIRPLYYTVSGSRLYFGSEVKAILASGEVEARLDAGALGQVFTYWSTLPGRTLFSGVSELPAGHWLRVVDGRIETQCYWRPLFSPPEECRGADLAETAEAVRALIDDAIRIRLRADVPVGCYVSGGLDSSAVATLLCRNYNHDVRTFGIRFEDPDFDEGRFQRLVVDFLSVQHTEVEATNGRIGESLPEAVWHGETPLLRTAPVPLFLLSQVVREHGFKVVLAGEGGDEVFAGYNIFREALIRRAWAEAPDGAHRAQHVETLYPYIFKRDPKLKHLLASFFSRGLERADDPFFSHLVRWGNTARLHAFFSPEVRRRLSSDADELAALLPADFDRWHPLARAQYLEMRIFLSNYLLSSQGDRMAMGHSVEVRLPFLDYRLIEFMGRVPAELKMHDLREKHLLKATFRGILPDAVLDRPKQPYRAPIKNCLLLPKLDYVGEMLSPRALAESGLFDADKVGRLVRKLRVAPAGSEVDNMALVGIVTAQLFFRRFFVDSPARTAAPVQPDLLVDRRAAGQRATRPS
ncbi:asparagine synthase (glutamine-hydrolyzing) [bacterium]|nr:asparagine synthase (glutamine-hydrolyzing) [bacterium]